MATAKYVISSHHFKTDGTINVKLLLYHQGNKKYIPTSVFLCRSQVSKTCEITDPHILNILDGRMIKIRGIIAGIDNIHFLHVDEVAELLLRELADENFKLDFFAFAETQMAKMEKRTADVYKTALNALSRYINGRKLDINNITYNFVRSFREFLEQETKVGGKGKNKETKAGCRSISLYLSCIRHIHNLARERYNEDGGKLLIKYQPFQRKIVPPQPPTRHRTLSRAQIQSIIDYRTDDYSRIMLACDCFLLSFALVGMNSIDLYNLKKSDVDGGFITYNRAKTDSRRADNAPMMVRIEPAALPLFEKYKAAYGEYYFNFAIRYATSAAFNCAINRGLKKMAAAIGGLPANLQYYHARHSWATIARNVCNVPFDTIHESLCHSRTGADRVTDIYIERSFDRVWDANARVLSLFDWCKRSENSTTQS